MTQQVYCSCMYWQ